MISFTKGFFDAFSGFSLLLKPGIRRFVLIPLLINLTLFSLASWWISHQLDVWLASILPTWLSWLQWLIWPLFAITIFLVVFYSFTLLANLIASPFNSILSANVESYLHGKKPVDITTQSFIKLTARTTKSELQKIFYALKWMIPIGIITIIPGLNIISPFLWFTFAAWFFAMEYNDYPLANRGKFFNDIKSYNQKNRLQSLGFGSAVFLLTSIPILNFFAMPVAIAGATKMVSKKQLDSL